MKEWQIGRNIIFPLIITISGGAIVVFWMDKEMREQIVKFIVGWFPLLVIFILPLLYYGILYILQFIFQKKQGVRELSEPTESIKPSVEVERIVYSRTSPDVDTYPNKIWIHLQFNQTCYIVNGFWRSQNTDVVAPSSLVWRIKDVRGRWTTNDITQIGVRKAEPVSTYVSLPLKASEEAARTCFNALSRPFGRIIIELDGYDDAIEVPV